MMSCSMTVKSYCKAVLVKESDCDKHRANIEADLIGMNQHYS